MTISCKAWNSPVEYYSWECKHGIKESKRKHVQSNFQGECPGAETPTGFCICRTRITYVNEAKSIDQKVINSHKNPSDSHNYHDWNHDEIEFYLGNSDRSTWWHSTLEQRTPKKKQSDWLYGYGVLLANVQCHRYLNPYHDIENTGTYNWKHTWNHTVSNYPIHQHGHTNFWYACLLERLYFN